VWFLMCLEKWPHRIVKTILLSIWWLFKSKNCENLPNC
jgi:hypothetical protein